MTERRLRKLNRGSDGTQLQNTEAARLLSVVVPALDMACGVKIKRATPKRRPHRAAASLPV